MKTVDLPFEKGSPYFAKIDGVEFFVGRRVRFEGTNRGLENRDGNPSQRYNRHDFRQEFGFWADFIHPTAVAEGGLFHSLNTFDRAHFTFGCLQFAAHVPNGDFVKYVRRLLELPLAKEYFPDLRLMNGRIVVDTGAGVRHLETASSTAALMAYFNPSVTSVEEIEVIRAAKMIHWVQNDPAHRHLQVELGIAEFKTKLPAYAREYKLDGVADTICLMVADIRHQGRAETSAIKAALATKNPLEALLKIGSTKYAERIRSLRREIAVLTAEGKLGTMKYSQAARDFVPMNGSPADEERSEMRTFGVRSPDVTRAGVWLLGEDGKARHVPRPEDLGALGGAVVHVGDLSEDFLLRFERVHPALNNLPT